MEKPLVGLRLAASKYFCRPDLLKRRVRSRSSVIFTEGDTTDDIVNSFGELNSRKHPERGAALFTAPIELQNYALVIAPSSFSVAVNLITPVGEMSCVSAVTTALNDHVFGVARLITSL